MKTISLTVPMDYNALTRASDMLHGLAIDLSKEQPVAVEPVAVEPVAVEPVAVEPVAVEPVAAAVFATPAPTAEGGVDLDGEGLPWDNRIHAGSKTKLSKKPGAWKKKRGVDDALVAQVETELRAAMSAGPANPVVATAEPAVTTEQPAPAPAPATGAVTTFPALMAAITANAIDQAAVTAAVNAQGLTALPLLAARPDLIPAVAAALGV